MFIKKKLKYFTRTKQISPDLSGVSHGDFRIVWVMNFIEQKLLYLVGFFVISSGMIKHMIRLG